MPRDIRGKFYSRKRKVWGGSKRRRIICPLCADRPCVIPPVPESMLVREILHVNRITGEQVLTKECIHCICWSRYKHCCWCGKAKK